MEHWNVLQHPSIRLPESPTQQELRIFSVLLMPEESIPLAYMFCAFPKFIAAVTVHPKMEMCDVFCQKQCLSTVEIAVS